MRACVSGLFGALSLLLSSAVALAHVAGLDRYGCHSDAQPGSPGAGVWNHPPGDPHGGGYHCHVGQFAGQSFRSQAEMLQKLRKSGEQSGLKDSGSAHGSSSMQATGSNAREPQPATGAPTAAKEPAPAAQTAPEPPITTEDKEHADQALCDVVSVELRRGESTNAAPQIAIARLLLAANKLMVSRFGIDEWRAVEVVNAAVAELTQRDPSGDLVTYCLNRSKPGESLAPHLHWYEGGTLHDATAATWRHASAEDKLATCADFVAALWRKGHLNAGVTKNLHSVDDLLPLAGELVSFLNAATADSGTGKVPDEMKIRDMVAAGVVMMGWSK